MSHIRLKGVYKMERIYRIENILTDKAGNPYNNIKYHGEIIVLNVPIQVRVLIFAIIGFLLLEALYIFKKKWNIEYSLDKILSLGSCISIFGFNLYNFVGNVVPSDLHHPFENVIGYNQIFQLGQIPFKEYIPF